MLTLTYTIKMISNKIKFTEIPKYPEVREIWPYNRS
jgi:hypothetical protein